MFRYVAVVPRSKIANSQNSHRVLAQKLKRPSLEWDLAFESADLVLYCSKDQRTADRVVTIPGRRGVLVGEIFNRGSEGKPQRVIELRDRAAENIVRTRGRSLVESHWGSYVIFLCDQEGVGVCVFRGPVSRLPCFYVEIDTGVLFFSHPEDILNLEIIRPTVNFATIRAHATCGDYLTEETAVDQIRSVLPGLCIEVSKGDLGRNTYWSPYILSRREGVEDFATAVALLESCARMSVTAWGTSHAHVLATVSGGFDSSVVLGLLREIQGGPEITGLNCYDASAADEREYARSMAKRTGIKLIERPWNDEIDFRCFLKCAVTAVPSMSFTSFDFEPACVALAHELGATAVLGGELGDDVFGRTAGPELLADTMWRHGFGMQFLRTALHYAQFKRLSIWRTIILGKKFGKFLNSAPFWSLHRYAAFLKFDTVPTLVTADVLDEYEQSLGHFIHPWYREIDGVPPGWFQLMLGIITASSSLWQPAFAGDADDLFLHPLVSQPLVEAYARIPAHFHIADGHTGTVARRAFDRLLSDRVRNRGRSKGTASMWLIEVIRRNEPFLREFLLDGVLVRERILDRGKVEAAISGRLGGSSTTMLELVPQLYIEGWLRNWTDVRLRAAA